MLIFILGEIVFRDVFFIFFLGIIIGMIINE